MCPGLVLVEARHELYVDYHRRIVEAVESCLPVTAVLSIDEMACRLMGRERPLLAAMELCRRVKARIIEQVGPMMRSSVGLATNRYLAKIASDMEKPDGLVALPLDILPEALRQLTLRDLPGIGAKTEKRLNDKGIHTMEQLLALKEAHPDVLKAADCLLMMSDFVHWALCGSRVVEFTIGSTSQCLNPVTRNWASGLLKKFGLPARIFPKVVMPGTKLGALRPSIAGPAGLGRVQVIAPPAHDTASAVAGVPTSRTGAANWAYISSGTWSLMGAEVNKASLSARTQELNLTNEGGLDGTYRLLKNIMGLWLVQQCKRAFDARGRKYEYAQLAQMAAKAPALRSIVNPDDSRFLNPPDMPKAIQDFCRETRQPVPRTEGELVRCAYESLALKYREVLGWLEELTGNRIEVIHIVGGGSKNALLNQFTANACGVPVVAGPVETTVLGNLLSQVRANGKLKSLAAMRDVVRASAELVRFEPKDKEIWTEAHARFTKLLK